jgi:hypothetical protein
LAVNEPIETADTEAKTLPGKGANMRPEELYASILRNHKMGPFPNVRDDLYGSLRKLCVDKLPLDKLLTECLTKAQEERADAKDRKIPWKTSIRKFFSQLLARRAVLVDSENN